MKMADFKNVASCSLLDTDTIALTMVTVSISETSFSIYQTTLRAIPADSQLYIRLPEDLKSHRVLFFV